MNPSLESLGIDRLPVEERLRLVHEIWDSIAADGDGASALPPTDAQCSELQKRIEEDNARPDDMLSWEQVKLPRLPVFAGD